jgi:undecaprenyl-diphosphatase
MLGAVLLGLAGFGLVATDDLLKGPLYHADVGVNDAVTRGQAGGLPLHAAGATLTHLGDTWTVVAVTALAAGWMLWKRQWLLAGWCATISVCVELVVAGLKAVFQRNRPGTVATVGHDYSFPSGHTLSAVAAVGACIILATETYRRTRTRPHVKVRTLWVLALSLAAAVSLLTGLGRVLAQRHWMSDVMASWFLGLAVGGAILLALSRAAPGGEAGPKAPPKAPEP